MTNTSSSMETYFGDKLVTRDAVHRWESRRATAVLKKMKTRLGPRGIAELSPHRDIDTLLGDDLATQRKALTDLKMTLGHGGIHALLRRELAISERLIRLVLAASRGRTAHSVVRIVVPQCTAQGFVDWFNNLTVNDGERDLVDASPDHYLIRGLSDTHQEVIETTGGSPAATRFVIDYSTADRLTIPIHADYPVQIAGHAALDDGVTVGGVRHQFRDREDGTMEALLSVQFPALLPHRNIVAHQWHLASEFGNWITASTAVRR